jgi:hypothetical protein
MISVLLLPILLAADTGSVRPTAFAHDDPPIQLWINNDRRFFPGDRAKVQVRTEEDGYLVVVHVDPEGYLRVLFPLDPDKDNFVRGGKKYEVKGRGNREAFETDGRGRGTVYAAVSREPFRFEGFVAGDHWDYRALAPSRLSTNPEPELNELVRRIAQGDFDYDLLNYDVVDRSAYVSTYTPRYYGSLYDDPWCYSFCGRAYYGSPFSVSVFFGRPYRRYYYDPYYYAYDPFYNPFFYDPYYYAPAYYPRYVYPRRYYYPYRDRWYYDGSRYGHAYTPYRFRGDGFNGTYRDRRYELRSVNTVYNPPVTTVREPAIANPARRVIEGPAADLPDGPAQRRLIDNATRVQGRPEARRARPAESREDRSAGEPRLIRREVEARPSREQSTGREASAPRDDRRSAPAADRAREAPRSIERAPAREAPPPRREVDRGSTRPSSGGQGGARAEPRGSSGGGNEAGGRANGGGRRPR